jgi:alpha-tubulin suppressor-like RCC1 family protein
MDPEAGEPVWVTGLDDAVEVHVGSGFACARRSTGGVVCWGGNSLGQLGDGNLPASGTVVSGPVQVVGIVDAEGLAVGGNHACALRAAGSVRCWGYGHFAQLGDGIAYGFPEGSGAAIPVDVLAPDGAIQLSVTQVAAGGAHSCALLSDHTVWCWGRAMSGELGDGSFHPGFEGSGVSHDLVQVLDLDDAVQISAGGAQTCALRASGRVACWGNNGVASDTANAVDVCGSEGTVQLAAGDDHVCALLASGGVLCWGYGSPGNLGDGVEYVEYPSGSATPVSVIGLNDATEVAAGSRESCARTAAGNVYCWGDGRYGALGTPDVESSNVPLEIHGLDLKASPP